jgi:DNA-binding transcriptional MerR regulator
VRISELAERVGVPASTVRYYERVGLIASPARTAAGYRDYDDDAAARLLFVTRARRMGLTCEQIAEVLPIWGGANCAAAHEEVTRLVETKRTEIAERIRELERFAQQLDDVHAALAGSPPPGACLPDLSCCVPETDGPQVAPITLIPSRSARFDRTRR